MRKYTARAVIVTLAALLVFATGYGWRQTSLAESYRTQVNSGFQKALHETSELVDSMRINLSKLLVTGSTTNRRKLLTELAIYAQSAQADLAALPEHMPFMTGALKFFNQVADFAVATVEDDETSRETIDSLLAACASLSDELNAQVARAEAGEDIFAGAGEVRADRIGTTEGAALKYPSLLYDGPFSDGRKDVALKLSGDTVTQEQAEQMVKAYIGPENVQSIKLVMESDILAPCYEFDVGTEDGLLSVAITRQGGQILYILCDTAPQNRAYSVGECVDFADRFLSQRGYGEMRVSYWQLNDAVITVNFAAVQNDVILYPDLVKVDVSMHSGRVIGIEAANYLVGHGPRNLPEPAITAEVAETLISSGLKPVRTRMCVIPLPNGDEAFCYEVSASAGNENYLVYIDAVTGEEVEILKIMEDENGQLAV